jgi:hypothetical protein
MEVIAGNGLIASVGLALGAFLILGMFADYRWRTAVVAVVAVGALNLFYAGGAPRVVANLLRPFYTLATTRPAPPLPVEKPTTWPP